MMKSVIGKYVAFLGFLHSFVSLKIILVLSVEGLQRTTVLPRTTEVWKKTSLVNPPFIKEISFQIF